MPKVIGEIVCSGNSDFAIVDVDNLRGGYVQVATKSDLDDVVEDKLKEGMLAYCQDAKTFYQYLGGTWESFTFGGVSTEDLEKAIADLKASYDADLDTDSENAVQNKVVAKAMDDMDERIGHHADDINDLQEAVKELQANAGNTTTSYDTDLDTDSENAVQNRVVAKAIDDLIDSVNERGDSIKDLQEAVKEL